VFGDGEHKNIEKELEKELMRTFFDEAPRKADSDNYACPKNPQVLARVVPMDEICLVHRQVMDHGSSAACLTLFMLLMNRVTAQYTGSNQSDTVS
jgi:hypothetical protein